MADSGSPRKREEEEEDDVVCLDPSFFVDRSYEMTTFTFGSHVLNLLCLRAASTDYDLTGQLVWPGAVLMNDYLSEHPETVKGRSVIELGSGIGITGILCSRFCKKVVLTDHNDEVLEARFKFLVLAICVSEYIHMDYGFIADCKIINKNIEMQSCGNTGLLTAEKLDWGNYDHISNIINKHPVGFDIVLGADIYILLNYFTLIISKSFQQSSISYLFNTVEKIMQIQAGNCRFILAYVSRAKVYVFSQLHGIFE
ncbi:hypothetical protein PR202_gb21837 [Eleusine coracana subsp. coracana]|uniref:Methyltransferase family protein n=1 Tax=Eleusine coracana subsp. coracana TaxID=191504 RepID=A0AAV5FEE7_ELECO|nr:hypothetical protein PR202_gb21837 [Eleusine coracana subsp. coracana]